MLQNLPLGEQGHLFIFPESKFYRENFQEKFLGKLGRKVSTNRARCPKICYNTTDYAESEVNYVRIYERNEWQS